MAVETSKAAAHSEVEESEGDELGSDAGSTVPINTGKRRDLSSYNFSVDDEATLVKFYREHDCFYNILRAATISPTPSTRSG